MGQSVRYDATHCQQNNNYLVQWDADNKLFPFCPEVAGGMTVPRAAAEIVGGKGEGVLNGSAQVIDNLGNNVSQYFIDGAHKALEMCQINNISLAILTERSPSCGGQLIYNGLFNKTRIEGEGVTTALLRQQGILVFNQYQLHEVNDHVY